MPSQTYLLDPDNPQRLEIAWGLGWRGASVSLDGQNVGTVPGRRELLAGQTFRLPDGSMLKLRLIQRLTGSELHILRDGQPIPGSASHPQTAVNSAYWVLFLAAAMDIGFSVMGLALHVDLLGEMGVGAFSLAFGVAYVILGFLVKRGSPAALYAGIGLFVLDAVLGLVLTARSGVQPGMFNIIFRGMILIPLIQGVGGMRRLKEPGGTNG